MKTSNRILLQGEAMRPPRPDIMSRAWSLALVIAMACGGGGARDGKGEDPAPDTAADTGEDAGIDADGDGHDSEATGGDDCDDTDPAIYVGAPEDCHGWTDSDCDGSAHLCQLSDSDVVFTGPLFTGFSAALLEDQDGDGRAEVMVASYLTPGEAGGVFIMMSSEIGDEDAVWIGYADCHFLDQTNLEWDQGGEGFVAKSVGDIDGGGMSDLAFGRPYDDLDWESQVFLVFGENLPCPSQTYFENVADVTIVGPIYEYVGDILTSGDVGGDGRHDLVLGVPRHSVTTKSGTVQSGAVYVLDGASMVPGRWEIDEMSGTLVEGVGAEALGTQGVVARDFDGDGLADLATGIASDPPVDYLFLGDALALGASISTADADLSIVGDDDGGELDYFVVWPGGDVDGDGREDLVTIAPETEAGVAYLWYGGGTGFAAAGAELATADADVKFVVTESQTDTYAVGFVREAGDLDADGRGDLLCASGVVDDTGRLAFFYGASIPPSGTVDPATADARFAGPPDDRAPYVGGGVGTGKDVNGDGIDDLLIGDSTRDSAYLIYGW